MEHGEDFDYNFATTAEMMERLGESLRQLRGQRLLRTYAQWHAPGSSGDGHYGDNDETRWCAGMLPPWECKWKEIPVF